MENRAHAIAAVSFLIVFSLGAVFVYFWLANRQNESLPYAIVTSESVGGLAPQSEVHFKGLLVGHVRSIAFNPQDRAQVIIQLGLKPHTYVTHQTYAQVATQGLAGGTILELKLGPGSRAPLTTSAAHPARIPLHEGVLGSLMDSAPKVMQQLQQTLASVNQVLDAGNRQHLAATLAQLDTATRQLASIEAQLPALLKGAQQSITASHKLLTDSDTLVRDAQTPVQNAAQLEASIAALATSTRQLSERVNHATLPNIDALSQSLQQTSRQLDALLRELRAKPQSLLFGPPKPPPGPGEPGFKARSGGK